jgi:hypothetical protein
MITCAAPAVHGVTEAAEQWQCSKVAVVQSRQVVGAGSLRGVVEAGYGVEIDMCMSVLFTCITC